VITEGEYGKQGSITLLQADDGVITIIKMSEGIENPHFVERSSLLLLPFRL
jgi:hypothetical protein